MFDGDIIVIIEGIEHFKDFDTRMESNLKFWLPRVFPDRVRFIITVDQHSMAHNYLTGIGSEVIHMSVEKKLYFEMIQSMKARPHFCTKEHHAKCYKTIEQEYENDEIDNTLYIKSFCSAFVPYETKSILNSSEIDPNIRKKINSVMTYVDMRKFEDIEGIDQMMQYILEFFEDKIMNIDKFKKTMCMLILTFKG